MFQKFRATIAVATAVCGWAAAQQAAAQTTIEQTTGASQNCYYSTNTSQSFTVPAGVSSIQSLSIGVGYYASPGQVRVSLRASRGSAEIVGATSSTTVAYSGSSQLSVNAGGYPVSANQTYVIQVVDTAGTSVICPHANTYAGGTYDIGNDTGLDAPFRVVFNDTPRPVPTMSEWAMILLGLIMAGGAAVYIQRRRLVA